MDSNTFKGVVRGKTIELERAPDLPDGQPVTITVQTPTEAASPTGAGLRRSFGAWADAGQELDQFLDQLRQERKRGRPGTDV